MKNCCLYLNISVKNQKEKKKNRRNKEERKKGKEQPLCNYYHRGFELRMTDDRPESLICYHDYTHPTLMFSRIGCHRGRNMC